MNEPRRYETQQIRRRVTRPVHSRRAAVIEAAEAVFKIHDEKQPTTDNENNSRLIDTSHDETKAGRK